MACQFDGDNGEQFNGLLQDVDAMYSKCFPTKNGNVRGFYNWIPVGGHYTGSVARFRMDVRGEVVVQLHRLRPRQILFLIGKLESFKLEKNWKVLS